MIRPRSVIQACFEECLAPTPRDQDYRCAAEAGHSADSTYQNHLDEVVDWLNDPGELGWRG